MNHLVGQGTGPRHYPDRPAGFVNGSRHNTNFGLARCYDSRTVGTDHAAGFMLQIIFDLHHIQHRNPFGDDHYQIQPGISGLHDCVGGKGRRNKDQAAICPGTFDSVLHGIKYRNIIHFLPGFAGCYTGNNLCSVIDAMPSVKLSFSAGYPLNHNPRIFICKNTHVLSPISDISPQKRRGRREDFLLACG